MLFELGFFFLWMGDSLSIKYLRVCLISPFAVRDCAAHLTGVLDQVADVFRAAAAYYFALIVSDRMNTERQVKIFREDQEMIYVIDRTGKIVSNRYIERESNDHWDEDSPSYSKYGGYNGWDDNTIDEAFDGNPELTWNVD